MVEKIQNLVATRPYLASGVLLVLLGALGSVPLGDKILKIQDALLQWVLLAIGLLLIVIDVYSNRALSAPPALDGVTGGISQPTHESHHVPAVVEARGWVKGLKAGHHLWLVVENNNCL